jgi:hypothetical protein
MDVGSLRERILVALLIHKFGAENVETEFPITEPEIDAKLFRFPVSIETRYKILLVNIEWNRTGGVFYIPLQVQKRVFEEIGREEYIKLPVPGTNPRGVELSKEALLRLLKDKETRSIEIEWRRAKIDFNPYQRWLDYWKED